MAVQIPGKENMNTPHSVPPGRAAALAAAALMRHRNAHVRVTRRLGAARILGAVIALLIMLALKRHYSSATADQLNWILAPTAGLLAWLTPAHPVFEYGVGYVDVVRGIIVAPACSGINFMIMSFGLGAFYAITRIRRMTGLSIGLFIVLCSAYGYTLVVNVLRIAISMILYDAHFYNGWVTIERVHRLAGIGIYLTALCVFSLCLRLITDSGYRFFYRKSAQKEHLLPDWLPLFWYLLGVVGVPLVNGFFQPRAPLMGEHCITILIMVACFWSAFKLACRLLAYASIEKEKS